MSESKELATQDYASRFLTALLAEAGKDSAGNIRLTDYQKGLAQSYFVGIDMSLEELEAKRIQKNAENENPKFNNNLPICWKNIDFRPLARKVVQLAKVGLDIHQKNHVSLIPYADKTSGKYKLIPIIGYSGIEFTAMRYALDTPVSVICELVYETDIFEPIKANINQLGDSFNFKIANPFDRGSVIGGFGYIQYTEPKKNKLVIMSLKEMLKRKPKHASAEFWGGTRKVKDWRNKDKDGKPTWKTEETEGWQEQMLLKTLMREVYNERNIPRDPKKIDDAYLELQREELEDELEIANNSVPVDAIDVSDFSVVDEPKEEETKEEFAPELKATQEEEQKEQEIIPETDNFDW